VAPKSYSAGADGADCAHVDGRANPSECWGQLVCVCVCVAPPVKLKLAQQPEARQWLAGGGWDDLAASFEQIESRPSANHGH